VLAFGDAWFPNHGEGEIFDRARKLRAEADRPIDLMLIGVPADPAALERAREAGCRRVVHWIPSAGLAGVEAGLEKWESAIAELTGEA
jgi:hypothetical protein